MACHDSVPRRNRGWSREGSDEVCSARVDDLLRRGKGLRMEVVLDANLGKRLMAASLSTIHPRTLALQSIKRT